MTQPVDFLNQPQPDQQVTEQDWLSGDLSRLEEYEPYDWGELDPLTLGKAVQYVPGIGLVVENGKDKDNA